MPPSREVFSSAIRGTQETIAMDELLRQLLNQLDEVGATHEEVFDSECRERMGDAVFDGFIRQRPAFSMPTDFGLHSANANAAVRNALASYIDGANRLAASLGLTTFHQRLSAFQNSEIESEVDGNYYDDFFGYSAPEAFDVAGNAVTSL